MLIGWRHILATIFATALAGIAVVWLGLIDVRASSGHWRLTDWFLHWAMRSSVSTAALGLERPPLENPALLPLAAGHYEAGCAYCHGSPANPPSAIARGMLPAPPDLATTVPDWTDEQLFEIVKHGIRFTGMPAWSAQSRDDEVWSIVAFLRAYPAMKAGQYRQLAGYEFSTADDFQAVLRTCEGCHAATRLESDAMIPTLDGQSRTYLLASLKAYSDGRRPSGVMQKAVHGLDMDLLEALATHYALRPASDHKISASGDAARQLAERGVAGRRIAPCLSCHDRPGINPAFPRLTGQRRAYLATQLKLFVSGNRGGTDYQQLMTAAVKNLTVEEIDALAGYFAGIR